MKKLIAKLKQKKASHPEHGEEVESDVMDALLEPEPTSDAMSEAVEILSRLANSMPAHMGTSHGLQLIHDAKAWVSAHVEQHEA